MTVLELKSLLKKCNDEDLIKIQVRKFSDKKQEIVDKTIEEPEKAVYEIFLNNEDDDTLLLCVTLYED